MIGETYPGLRRRFHCRLRILRYPCCCSPTALLLLKAILSWPVEDISAKKVEGYHDRECQRHLKKRLCPQLPVLKADVTILEFLVSVPFDIHTANSELNVCFRMHENALAEVPIFFWSHHGVLAWAVHASHSSGSG